MHHWPVAWWTTLTVLAVATFTDLRSRRIPNWLVLPFLAAGIAVSPWRADWHGNGHGAWHGLGQCFAGMGLGFLLMGLLFWVGGMGAGDVKLFTAIGAWVGPMQLFFAFITTAIVGGILILCWIAYLKVFKGLLRSASDLVMGRKRNEIERIPEKSLADLLQSNMPYAPAIAVGTLLSFFAG
jgi:prepilin peptidase CpaA